MPASRARLDATARYEEKVYDKVLLRLSKGKKATLKAHADTHDGGSLNGFINRAIDETMERDGDVEV